jgi:hypothetical protein
MANHVTSILVVEGENPSAVLKAIKGRWEDRNGEPGAIMYIDFNKIRPMPEILRADSSTPHLEDLAKLFLGAHDFKELLSPPTTNPLDAFREGRYGDAAAVMKRGNLLRTIFESKLAGDLDDEGFERLLLYMRAYREHGHCSWYSWSNENWGTKGNAYHQQPVRNGVRFDTAWATPAGIWDALSRMFPDNVLHVRWADEDGGNNVGDMRVRDGEVIEGGPLDDGSPEACRLYVDLKWEGSISGHEYLEWKEDGTLGHKPDEDEDEEDEEEDAPPGGLEFVEVDTDEPGAGEKVKRALGQDDDQ